MTEPRKTPLRRCAGCREMKEKHALLRVTRTPAGTVLVDETGKLPGRGAYVCRNAACAETARRRKGLERSFKQDIGPEVYAGLQAAIGRVEV